MKVAQTREPGSVGDGVVARRNRRPLRVGPVLAAAGALLLAGLATGAPARAAPSAPPGSKVCSFGDDDRLTGVTGLVAGKDGFQIVNDTDSSGLSVYRLDTKSCEIQDTPSQDSRSPVDAQDLGATPDGALWVADTGNGGNDQPRDTVSVWKFGTGGSGATKYDLTFPDGAQAPVVKTLLMNRDGTPVLVSASSDRSVYVPDGPLDDAQPTPLKKVGQIKLTATGTPGGSIGPGGQLIFTGGAVAPDGSRVVLRTYTDAYQWKVSGKDIAHSILSGTPRRTALPNEPQGEAISFTADGSSFLTVSNTGTNPAARINKYKPTALAPASHPARDDSADDDSGGGFFSRPLSQTDIERIIIAVGVLGIGLVVLGVVGIRRSRRHPPTDDGPDERPRRGDRPRPGDGADAETVVIPRVSDRDGPGRRARPEPPAPRRRRAEPDVSNADTDVIDKVDERATSRHGQGPPPSRRPGRQPDRRRDGRHDTPGGRQDDLRGRPDMPGDRRDDIRGRRPDTSDDRGPATGARGRRGEPTIYGGRESAGTYGRRAASGDDRHRRSEAADPRGREHPAGRRGDGGRQEDAGRRGNRDAAARHGREEPTTYGRRTGTYGGREEPTTYGRRATPPGRRDGEPPNRRAETTTYGSGRPPAARQQPRDDGDIDWLDDVGAGGSAPSHHDPAPEPPSGQIRRRLR